jgi:hypothetical protein
VGRVDYNLACLAMSWAEGAVDRLRDDEYESAAAALSQAQFWLQRAMNVQPEPETGVWYTAYATVPRD